MLLLECAIYAIYKIYAIFALCDGMLGYLSKVFLAFIRRLQHHRCKSCRQYEQCAICLKKPAAGQRVVWRKGSKNQSTHCKCEQFVQLWIMIFLSAASGLVTRQTLDRWATMWVMGRWWFASFYEIDVIVMTCYCNEFICQTKIHISHFLRYWGLYLGTKRRQNSAT